MKIISFFQFLHVMEHRWNEIDGRKPKYSGKNLSQCHFVYHKSHTDWPGIEPGPPGWEAGDSPLEQWHGPNTTLSHSKGELELQYVCYICSSILLNRASLRLFLAKCKNKFVGLTHA
jgi:hypothetical protein